MLLSCIVLSAIGFISGSLMFSYFIPKAIKGVDVRNISRGDGNPGSSNAIRAAGFRIGFICMALDVLKAFIPVFVAVTFAQLEGYYLVPVMLAPVLGHAFSPFLGFKGGKAISTVYGVLLAILPISKIVILLALIMVLFKFIVVISPDSSGVLASMCGSIVLVIIFEPLLYIKLAFILISALIIYKIQINPNVGTPSVNVWHLSLTFENNKLNFHKV